MHVRVVIAHALSLFLLLSGCGPHATAPINQPVQLSIVYGGDDGFIYTMNTDGSNKKRLFDSLASYPFCSPNGAYIAAYWLDFSTGDSWIVAFDGKSGAMHKLALVAGTGATFMISLSWSPDGQTIAFERPTAGVWQSDLYTVSVDGRTLIQLTHGGFNHRGTWSSDGQQIQYQQYQGSTAITFIVNKDGSNTRPSPYRPNGLVNFLAWSPDGANVALDGPPDSSSIGTTASAIYLADIAGKQVSRVTDDHMSAACSWSPDASLIAFVSDRDGGLNGYVMNRNGSNQRRLTKHGLVVGGPLRWSPDGTKLLYPYKAGAPKGVTIAVVDADGSRDLNLDVSSHGFDWIRQ